MSVFIDKALEAEQHDNAVRYRVTSERDPHVTYLVDLTDYSGNGRCTCTHFQCRLEPLLSRMFTPEKAYRDRLVPLYPKQRMEDALRCKHICEAREYFTQKVLKAIAANDPASKTSHP